MMVYIPSFSDHQSAARRQIHPGQLQISSDNLELTPGKCPKWRQELPQNLPTNYPNYSGVSLRHLRHRLKGLGIRTTTLGASRITVQERERERGEGKSVLFGEIRFSHDIYSETPFSLLKIIASCVINYTHTAARPRVLLLV
jgi:hypothetical protein